MQDCIQISSWGNTSFSKENSHNGGIFGPEFGIKNPLDKTIIDTRCNTMKISGLMFNPFKISSSCSLILLNISWHRLIGLSECMYVPASMELAYIWFIFETLTLVIVQLNRANYFCAKRLTSILQTWMYCRVKNILNNMNIATSTFLSKYLI